MLTFDGNVTKSQQFAPAAFGEIPQDLLALEGALRAASLKGVETLGNEIDLVGNMGAALDVLSLLKGYVDAYDQVARWEQMLDSVGGCASGRRPELEDAIFDAADMMLTANALGTSLTSLGIATTLSGAGAPLGAAISVTGLGIGHFLGDAAASKANGVEALHASILSESAECEEEDDDPDREPYYEDDRRRRRDRTRRRTADPIVKIDPSGFVYEVIENNRLAGVTATLLHGETETGPWVVSAAEEFGEINPQITPTGGNYRWDVPAGWWQVMYQKEGYETTYSDVLPVPPPHLDVNIPLKSLAPPEVLDVNSLNNGAALRINFANYIRATMASLGTIRLRDSQDDLLEGQVLAPAEFLVNNPHTESTAKDISMQILFVPAQSLTIGSTYTVEVDGVIESYGEIPLGETVSIEVTITDSRSGIYFGSFDPGDGLWAMEVDDQGAATLRGYDPDTETIFDLEGTIDEDGNLLFDLDSLAAGSQLTGTAIDGEISGSISILDYDVVGSRSLGEVDASVAALTYHGAVIGSKSTTLTAALGPDGTVLAVIDGELASAAAIAGIDSQGIFSGILSDGSELELDLSDPDGAMSGVLSLVDSDPWDVLGAVEGSPRARLVNVSGRGPVAASSGSLIAGFVTRGATENPMLVRAIGPGLEKFGLTGILEQPRIRLVDQSKPVNSNLVAENTNWLEAGNRNELRAIFAGLGAFFLEDAKADATVYLSVTPGPYTAVIQGIDGQAGITLVEAYDADLGVFGTTSEGVANLSLRGNVGTGSGVMIAGFVIEGLTPKQVLIRGVGPGLGTLGVSGYIVDPAITLYKANDLIRDNRSWGNYLTDDGLIPIFQSVGAFPLESGSKDAAIVIWLAPGPYTTHLRNEVSGEGIGLIEIYDLP
jgi:hypothetical protein